MPPSILTHTKEPHLQSSNPNFLSPTNVSPTNRVRFIPAAILFELDKANRKEPWSSASHRSIKDRCGSITEPHRFLTGGFSDKIVHSEVFAHRGLAYMLFARYRRYGFAVPSHTADKTVSGAC